MAGNAKNMPRDVRQAFVSVCMTCGQLTNDEANNYIKQMESNGRYQTECW